MFPELVQNLTYWNKNGVYTPKDLADNLTFSAASDLYKSEYGVRPHFQTVQEAQAYLDEYDSKHSDEL